MIGFSGVPGVVPDPKDGGGADSSGGPGVVPAGGGGAGGVVTRTHVMPLASST